MFGLALQKGGGHYVQCSSTAFKEFFVALNESPILQYSFRQNHIWLPAVLGSPAHVRTHSSRGAERVPGMPGPQEGPAGSSSSAPTSAAGKLQGSLLE